MEQAQGNADQVRVQIKTRTLIARGNDAHFQAHHQLELHQQVLHTVRTMESLDEQELEIHTGDTVRGLLCGLFQIVVVGLSERGVAGV